MQFAVALIEYLISGIVASAWLTAIINNYYQLPITKINDYKEIFIIIYLPITYILGIYVDTTSSYFIRRTSEMTDIIGKKIKIQPLISRGLGSLYRSLVGTPKADSYKKSAAILAHSAPDAVRTMEAYVSRDRIARGAAFNAFAGGITAFFYAPPEHRNLITIICAITFVYSYIMHKRLRRLSSRFKQVVLQNLQKNKSPQAAKIQREDVAEA